MYANIDTSEFPLVTIRFSGKDSTDERFIKYLEGLRSLYERKEELAIIFDPSLVPIPSLRHQKMQAFWIKENSELLAKYCKGAAYVVRRPAIRTILKLIFAVSPQPMPYKIVVTEEDAREWAFNQLKS